MKIYLVGGAVRDALLKREVTEHDFVVVGATPDDLLAKGFRPVGKDFPVFLHPKTQDEYALARTERKTGKGYTGFECFFDPTVTLEQDLLRRDLTINAMALEWDDLANQPKGGIIDPLKGQQDLTAKILRHVSPAFAEDPVRILRVARFAARFPDFRIDPETNQLMRNMADAGEVNALVPERVWKEFSRALTETDPLRFFEVLKDCAALPILFPEFARPPLPHHRSSFEYLSRSLINRSKAYNQKAKMPERIAEKNISHDNEIPPHETPDDILFFGALTLGLNETEITTLCQRLRPPTRFSDLAFSIAKNKHTFQTLNINEPTAVVDFLEKMDTYRRPGRLFDFCRIIRLTQDEYPAVEKIANTLTSAFEKTKSIEAKSFIQQGLTGEAIGKAIHNARIECLK